MRTVTRVEVEASRDYVDGMSMSEMRELMTQMSREQPYLQVYLAAVMDRGDLTDENDLDALANLAAIIWHAMRAAAEGRMGKVKPRAIERCERAVFGFLEYAAGETEEDFHRLVETGLNEYNQRPLLGFVVELLMSPDNPYGVTPDGSGLIQSYAKVLIDCLDQAPVYPDR